jgi:hypothetical protein
MADMRAPINKVKIRKPPAASGKIFEGKGTGTCVLPYFGTGHLLDWLESAAIIMCGPNHERIGRTQPMSQIYEALKYAQELRLKNAVSVGDSLGIMEMPDRRSGPRWDLGIHLTVYGRASDERPFYEEVQAFSVNADGGLLLLRVPVREGQDLLLINNRTSLEQICHVVHVRIRDTQTSEVAVTFPSAHPDFWQIPDIPGDMDEMLRSFTP